MPDILQELIDSVATGLSDAARKPSILNYVPQDNGQIKFHKSTSTGRLLAGSNRSGKSIAGCAETVWRLTGRHPYQKVPEPPVKGRIITVDFDNGADLIIEPLLKQYIPVSELKEGSWEKSYNRRKHTLTLLNGSTLEIKTHDQDLDSFAGVPRHFLWCDEEPPQSIFKESRTRLLDYRGCFYITMTPVEGMTWVFETLVENKDNNTELIRISVMGNKFISEEARNELARDLTEEERKIRIDGEFVPKGGLVLKEFDYDRHIIHPGIPDRLHAWYVSIDHGYNNPTAVYWHAVGPNDVVITFAEHYRAEWTVKLHAQRIHELNKLHKKIPELYIGDPSMSQRSALTGASVLQAYREEDIPVAPGKKDVAGGINRMNEYFRQNKWFITANCPNLIKEIRTYSYKIYNSAKIADRSNKREDPNKKNDHGVDSCRYFFSFMPDLKPAAPNVTKPKLFSATRTNPRDFPWTIDENLFTRPEPDLSFGEIP